VGMHRSAHSSLQLLPVETATAEACGLPLFQQKVDTVNNIIRMLNQLLPHSKVLTKPNTPPRNSKNLLFVLS